MEKVDYGSNFIRRHRLTATTLWRYVMVVYLVEPEGHSAPEVEVVKGNLVAESTFLSELELILRKVLRQNVTGFNSASRQSRDAVEVKVIFTNLKTFLFSMKTATLRLFSLKKFTTPLIMVDYTLLVSRCKS